MLKRTLGLILKTFFHTMSNFFMLHTFHVSSRFILGCRYSLSMVECKSNKVTSCSRFLSFFHRLTLVRLHLSQTVIFDSSRRVVPGCVCLSFKTEFCHLWDFRCQICCMWIFFFHCLPSIFTSLLFFSNRWAEKVGRLQGSWWLCQIWNGGRIGDRLNRLFCCRKRFDNYDIHAFVCRSVSRHYS